MEELQYHEQRDFKNEKKLQELLASLPPFCADFFRGIEPATSSMTRHSYAYDISVFCIYPESETRIIGPGDKRNFHERFL